MITTQRLLLALAAIVIVPATALAKERDGGNEVDAVAACRDVADASARLACFDAAAAALVAARDKKDLVVLNRAEVQKTRRSLFGFALPRIRLFGGGEDDGNAEDIQEINGSVTGVTQVSADRWMVTLDDDTRWITTESARGFPPRAGETVRIRRAALGSYDASFNKRRSIKVKRTG